MKRAILRLILFLSSLLWMTGTSYGQATKTVTRVFSTASKSITRSSNALSKYTADWSMAAIAGTGLTKVSYTNTGLLPSSSFFPSNNTNPLVTFFSLKGIEIPTLIFTQPAYTEGTNHPMLMTEQPFIPIKAFAYDSPFQSGMWSPGQSFNRTVRKNKQNKGTGGWTKWHKLGDIVDLLDGLDYFLDDNDNDDSQPYPIFEPTFSPIFFQVNNPLSAPSYPDLFPLPELRVPVITPIKLNSVKEEESSDRQGNNLPMLMYAE